MGEQFDLLPIKFDSVEKRFSLQSESFHQIVILTIDDTFRSLSMYNAGLNAVSIGFVAFGGGRAAGGGLSLLLEETFSVDVAE